jgi:Putative zinc-finger
MPCPIEIDELMSLKLDGLIDEQGDLRLDKHLNTCAECNLLWAAMKHADDFLRVSASEPLPVPSGFQMKVMAQIAVIEAEKSPALESGPLFQPAIGLATNIGTMPLATATRRLERLPTGSLALYNEWQHRVASYVRGIAAVGISLAGTVGLLLALVLSGTIKVSGPAADVVGTVRTFFDAVDTWAGSLFLNFGPGIVAVSLVIAGVLSLLGWQVVSSYHRSALENRGNTGVLEALA